MIIKGVCPDLLLHQHAVFVSLLLVRLVDFVPLRLVKTPQSDTHRGRHKDRWVTPRTAAQGQESQFKLSPDVSAEVDATPLLQLHQLLLVLLLQLL